LVDSQFDTLEVPLADEPDTRGFDAMLSIPELTEQVVQWLNLDDQAA
jgi:gluconate kinase